MFSARELATILAALHFWREEISPHERDLAQHYLKAVGMAEVEPLTVEEIEQLSVRLRGMQPD